MENNNYNIGDYVWLEVGCDIVGLYTIVDISESFYILDTADGDDSGIFTTTPGEQIPAFVAFEKKDFNAIKAISDEVEKWWGETNE